MGKLIMAAIVGGIVFFAWGALSHMVLPLGEMGFSELPNEPAILDTMRADIPEDGLYFFPWGGHDLEEGEEAAWQEKYTRGPVGLLAYQRKGSDPMSSMRMLTQFLSGVVAALIGAIVLSQSAVGYSGRVLIVTLMGLFAWLVVSVPHWNWYGFPIDFTIAEAIDRVVGWFFAGLALAAMVKPIKKP